jgi:CheY-like chemotaxis protein/HPt (histidine-containing phosphotransfer) domain-containing protein
MAEDNPFNNRIAKLLLARLGHTVTIVVNGREAIEALDREPFDLLLMDLEMPEMDGLQATIAIRAAESLTGRHVQIIALTAHAHGSDLDRCREAGMDDYVGKPIVAEKLRQAIERCVLRINEVDLVELPGGDSTSPIDKTSALSRVDGDRAFLSMMTAMFLVESPKLMDQIRDALARGDTTSMIAPLHKVKNWAGNFVASATLAAVDRVENFGRTASLADARTALVDLETEFERLTKALSGFDPSPPSHISSSWLAVMHVWSPSCTL